MHAVCLAILMNLDGASSIYSVTGARAATLLTVLGDFLELGFCGLLGLCFCVWMHWQCCNVFSTLAVTIIDCVAYCDR